MAKFTENGISYGQGGEVSPVFNNLLIVTTGAFANYIANFSGTVGGQEQEGTITLELNIDKSLITGVKVVFTKGTSYKDQTINCQFVNQ